MQQIYPLMKNEAGQFYESRIHETHIVVPFTEFESALIMRQRHIQEKNPGTTDQAANNLAYFQLIDATAWNDGRHECSRIDWSKEPYSKTGHRITQPEQEAGERTKTWKIDMIMDVDLDVDGEEAALERMSQWFYMLYQKAEQGSQHAAICAQVYSGALRTLAERESVRQLSLIADKVTMLEQSIDEGTDAIASSLGSLTLLLSGAIQLLSAGLEKELKEEARA